MKSAETPGTRPRGSCRTRPVLFPTSPGCECKCGENDDEKQGFGRAIRTETDTCVVAILDERSTPGQRHHEAMLAALPDIKITDSLEDVVEFIYRLKGPDYFKEAGS